MWSFSFADSKGSGPASDEFQQKQAAQRPGQVCSHSINAILRSHEKESQGAFMSNGNTDQIIAGSI